MNEFSFTTEDCIEMRKQVIKFYCALCGPNNGIPNVVDAANPWEDVVSDFQMAIYCYLFKEGMREVERAYETGVIRKEAKQQLTRVRETARQIEGKIPFGNIEFCSNYADIDDALSERVQRIVTMTYYPLLNNALKECNGLKSEVAQAMAHLITGMCFVIIACERGMIHTHHVPSVACRDLGDKICRLAGMTSRVNKADVSFNMVDMEKTVTDMMNVVINLSEKTMVSIIEHAKSLDLEPYVAAADYTKERFAHMMKEVDIQRKRSMMKVKPLSRQ